MACDGEGARVVQECGDGVISDAAAGMKVTCGVPPPDPDACGNPDPSTVVLAVQNLFWWNLFGQQGGGNFFEVFGGYGPFDVLLLQECDDIARIVQVLRVFSRRH